MIYLGNGMYSDSSLSHGGKWKTHKYIAIKNGRYIYPGDNTGSGNNGNNGKDIQLPGPSAAERAQTYKMYNTDPVTKSKHTQGMEYIKIPNKKSVAKYGKMGGSTQGPSVAEKAQTYKMYNTDPVAKSKHTKGIEYTNGRNFANRKGMGNSKQGPSAAELAKRNGMGNSTQGPSAAEKAVRGTSNHSKTVAGMRSGNNFVNKKGMGNSKQGPSAAELAKRNATSKTDMGYKTTGKIKKTTQGPSAAEKAMRRYPNSSESATVAQWGERKKTKTKASDVAKNYKNRAIKWVKKNIIGEEGKVYTGKELEKKKRNEKRNK